MSKIAIIGGTGLTQLEGLQIVDEKHISTPYGPPSDTAKIGNLYQQPVVFLARHGSTHQIAPHKINYLANIWALKFLGVEKIIAVNAVGGITAEMEPGSIVIPDQIIDYTYGREHTYSGIELNLSGDFSGMNNELVLQGFNKNETELQHVDFTLPYDEELRAVLNKHLKKLSAFPFSEQGIYGCTQGPRLETAAEIAKLSRDGCDIVGMTGMPEAALARELDMQYVSVCTVVNWAAGVSNERITMENIYRTLNTGMKRVRALIQSSLTDFNKNDS